MPLDTDERHSSLTEHVLDCLNSLRGEATTCVSKEGPLPNRRSDTYQLEPVHLDHPRMGESVEILVSLERWFARKSFEKGIVWDGAKFDAPGTRTLDGEMWQRASVACYAL